MSDRPITDDYGNTVDRRDAKGLKVAYDPRISLNTILMCLTAIGVSWGILDKITANATVTAMTQAQTTSNTAAIVTINQQRFIDRQELLAEIRELRADIKAIPRK